MPKTHGDGSLTYEAESPDEGALVNMAKYHGLKLVGRTQKDIILEEDGKELRWRVEAINEFTSARKCMSMLAKAPDGRYVLWVKVSCLFYGPLIFFILLYIYFMRTITLLTI